MKSNMTSVRAKFLALLSLETSRTTSLCMPNTDVYNLCNHTCLQQSTQSYFAVRLRWLLSACTSCSNCCNGAMIGFFLGLPLCDCVKQPVQKATQLLVVVLPHSFSLLSCKLVKDASLSFTIASYPQTKHVCHPISKANPCSFWTIAQL